MNRSLEINRDRVGLNVSQTYLRQFEEANQNFIKQHRVNTSQYEQIQQRLEETERQRIEALRRAEEAEYQRRTQQDLVLIADKEEEKLATKEKQPNDKITKLKHREEMPRHVPSKQNQEDKKHTNETNYWTDNKRKLSNVYVILRKKGKQQLFVESI